MRGPEHRYSVVLRAGLPDREVQLLKHFCYQLVSEGREPLLALRCTRVNTSHHYFLEADVISKDDPPYVHPLHIPQEYVLLISGNEDRTPASFLSSSESRQG